MEERMGAEVTKDYVDAHLHLQDERFDGRRDDCLSAMREVGIRRVVVNGTRESDWQAVEDLAAEHAEIIPSYGLHPWWLAERSENWETDLRARLSRGGVVGEIGLDRWKRDLPAIDEQAEVMSQQMALASEFGVPASIHCLRAFGRLVEVLESSELPSPGFLLHSYGGPMELVERLLELGAYFSFSGYFLKSRKAEVREVFAALPIERVLVESDAPDMPLPEGETEERFTWEDDSGRRLNHPANLPQVYAGLARVRGMEEADLLDKVGENFDRLFGVAH